MKLRIRDEDWVLTLVRSIRYKGESCFGLCDKDRRRIRLEDALPAKEMMKIALHETGHALNWDHDEDAIRRDAAILTDVLWKLGFRLVNPPRSYKGRR